MNHDLRKEFDYFIAHHADMVSHYLGRVVVIRGQAVVGDFANELDALADAQTKYEPGTFLIQRVKGSIDSYTQTFHSRVVFA